MPIPEKIKNFIGYGNIKPTVRFMGIEERLIFHDNISKDESLRRQIQARKTFETTMDLQYAIQDLLGFNLCHGRENRPRIQKTYLGMIAIMLGIVSSNDETKYRCNDLQRLYQAERLGRKNGTTLLSELFSLPLEAHNGNNWPSPYREEFGIGDFAEYLASDATERRRRLRGLIAPVTICYGKRHWDDFKTLFNKIAWQENNSIPFGTNGRELVILTNHFTAFGGLYSRITRIVEIVLENCPSVTGSLIKDREWLEYQSKAVFR